MTAITNEDRHAIKRADTFVFFWRPDGSEGAISGFRCGRDLRFSHGKPAALELVTLQNDPGWKCSYISEDNATFWYMIEAGRAPTCTLYDQGTPENPRKMKECVFIAYRSQTHIMTALNMFKAGDEFGLRFVGSNNSENDKSRGIHKDEVFLQIFRKEKPLGEFMLGYMVGPDTHARIVSIEGGWGA